MPKFLEIKCLIFLIFLLLIVVLAFSCAPARRVIGPQLESESFEYLQDGKTKRQEIIDRLGHPLHSYENGRIVIYSWFDKESKGYDIVLVFNEDNVLERHSVVRVR